MKEEDPKEMYYSDDRKTVLLHVGVIETKITANQINQLLNKRYKYLGSYRHPTMLIFRKEKTI